MAVDDITQVSGAMGALELQEDLHPTARYTLASIGTVLLDVFDAEPWTPAPMSPVLPCSPPMSTSSTVHDAELITPHGSPELAALSRPPSFEDLLNPEMSIGSSKPRAVLGGGALYALIGARVWLPPSEMRAVVDHAPRPRPSSVDLWLDNVRSSTTSPATPSCKDDDDFPSALQAEIEQFGHEMWVFNRAPGLRFPRTDIECHGDFRTYQHTVKPTLRTGHELAHGPLVGASYLHVSSPYSPSNLLQVLDELEGPWRPKVVFEPAPASCHPGEKEAFELVAQRVDILSPNYQELFGLYGLAMDTPIRGAVEQAVKHLLLNVGVGPGGDGIVLIRCGSRGACIGTRAGGLRWTPAYHGRDSLRVKDMTGASNAFLGGFVAGLKLTDGNPYEAALYGSVSASFVVEQYGLPRLTPSPAQSPIGFAASLAPLPRDNFLPAAVQNATRAMRLRAATGRAMWNTDRPQRRLELLRLRAATLA